MPDPERPVLELLPQLHASAAAVRQTPEQRDALKAYARAHHLSGRSIRQLAELMGRSQTAVRRALGQKPVSSYVLLVPAHHRRPRR